MTDLSFVSATTLKRACRSCGAQADFPWEEGFKWPWEKTEEAKEPEVKVESPETTTDEEPEPAPESAE